MLLRVGCAGVIGGGIMGEVAELESRESARRRGSSAMGRERERERVREINMEKSAQGGMGGGLRKGVNAKVQDNYPHGWQYVFSL